MEDYKEQLNHLKEMRSLMERSNKFLSLSGLSGILCGVYALVASALAFYVLYIYPVSAYESSRNMHGSIYSESYISEVISLYHIDIILIGIALATLLASVGTAFYLSHKKAKKMGEHVINPASKIMALHTLLPLSIGGIFGLICIYKGWFVLVPCITLIFYGVALISAAKFTFGEVLYLGILEALLGLLSLFFLGYGLLFWAIGFGVLHILYGFILYNKYDRKLT